MKHSQEMHGIVLSSVGNIRNSPHSFILFVCGTACVNWERMRGILVIFLAAATLSLYPVQPCGGLHGDLQLFGLTRMLRGFFGFKHEARTIIIKQQVQGVYNVTDSTGTGRSCFLANSSTASHRSATAFQGK